MTTKVNFKIAGARPHFFLPSNTASPDPKLKKSLRLEVANQLPANMIALHATLVYRPGLGILICGGSKSGKTTLSKNLKKYGFNIEANDFVAVWKNKNQLFAGDINFSKISLAKNALPINRAIFLSPEAAA
jgi:hypothetical protein